MRESLTVLAMLLIVVLTTALVGPYFVNWNAHRGEIEARLSTLLGADVKVAGPIDVKLLPRPIFRLQEVTVTGRSPRDGVASAARVDVELALTAMMRGEIRFVDADLTEPKITLTVGPQQTVVLPHFGDTDPDRVSLGHIGVHDGALLMLDATGQPSFALVGITGDGEAESLVGPFKLAGTVDTPRGALGFRLATGAYDGQKVRLKATLDPLAGLPKSDLEGTLTAVQGIDGAAALSLDGSVNAAGALPLTGSTATIPWRLTTRIHAEPAGIDASGLELRAGADGRALIANGDGRIDLSAAPTARLSLKARQADIGRLAVPAGGEDQPPPDAGDASPAAVPTIADDLAALHAVALDPDAFAALPLPVRLDYGVDTVTLGHQTLVDFGGQVTAAPGQPLSGTLSVGAPDGSRVKLDGTFEPGPAAVFKGRLDTASKDLGRLADGFAADLPDLADTLRHALPVKAFGFSGAIDLSGIGFAAHDVDLTLDRSKFTGTVTLTRAVGPDNARLFADLASDALDLDALPDWRDTAFSAAGLDLSLALSARALRLVQSDTGSVTAGRIDLRLNKAGPVVTLDRLALADIGGATADFTGRSDGKTAHAAGHLDARRLRDLLGLVHRVMPGAVTDQLLSRADALSPAIVAVSADAALDADGGLTPQALTLDGTAAGTRLALHLTSSDGGGTGSGGATLTLDAPETGALLRQIGLSTLPTTAVGRGHVEGRARLLASGGIEANLNATFGETMLTLEGRRDPADALSGHIGLKSANAAPLLRAVALATPGAGVVWPMDAAAGVTLTDRRLATHGLAGHLLGTGFAGDVTYLAPPSATATTAAGGGETATAPPAALTGMLTVDRLPLQILVGLALGPPQQPKSGAVWSDAAFGPGFLAVPRSEIALRVPTLPLDDNATARDASFTLRLGPGVVTLASLTATLGDGRIGGTLTLRRDGTAASLNGHVDWSGLPVASPSFGGRSRGSFDLAGTGTSLAAVAAGLAGSGSIGVDDARLPRLDVGAISRVVKTSDAATGTIDDLDIKDDVTRELDRGALSLGAVEAPVTVAAGTLRGAPIVVKGATAQSETLASLDLKTLGLSLKSTVTLLNLPKDWVGSAPQITVSWTGPFLNPTRDIDAASLVNGIAARAIARDQARIEAFQDDIRERAFFSRKLRAIEAEQQAARDQARAETEAQMQKLLQSLPTTPRAPARPALKPPLDLTRPGASPVQP